jgi:hypothetical protein
MPATRFPSADGPFFSSGHSTEIFGYINGIAVVVGLNQENNFGSRVRFVRIRVLERPIQVKAESSFRKPNLGQKMQMFAAVENQFPPEMSAARELTDIYREFDCLAILAADRQQPYSRRQGEQRFESVSGRGQSMRSHYEFERHFDHKFRGRPVVSLGRNFRRPQTWQTKTS